ncbi:TOBE domain-containing protein, partial [Streptomyces anandii]
APIYPIALCDTLYRPPLSLVLHPPPPNATRFLVDLDAGGRLTALQQNLETSAEDVAAYRGARVRLTWHRRHAVQVPGTR